MASEDRKLAVVPTPVLVVVELDAWFESLATLTCRTGRDRWIGG